VKICGTREEFLAHLIEYCRSRREHREHEEEGSRAPLLKSYLLEAPAAADPMAVFSPPDTAQRLQRVEEGLFCMVEENEERAKGYIEHVSGPYWLFYSNERSSDSDRFVERWVRGAPQVEQLWISGLLFQALWDCWLVQQHQEHRYIRMSFDFRDLFSDPDLHDTGDGDPEDMLRERRVSRINIMEQKQTLQDTLPALQRTLSSFYAIHSLRFPAHQGRGGHDVYFNGKVTNRSDDFIDHRRQIRALCGIYGNLTNMLEDLVPFGAGAEGDAGQLGLADVRGSAVVIRFAKALDPNRYHHFVEHALREGRTEFALWGNPVVLDEEHVHFYGLDMYYWQEVYLQLTADRIVLTMPGRRAAVIHRFLTQLQMLLEPNIRVDVADTDFGSLAAAAVKKGVDGDA